MDGKGHFVISVLKEGDQFATGNIVSEGKFEHAFGFYLARVEFQSQPGSWSAFWLTNKATGKPGGDGTPEEYIFVDGRETWRTEAGGVCQAPLYLIFPGEIGQSGGDIRKAHLPDKFQVDYVRVFDLLDE